MKSKRMLKHVVYLIIGLLILLPNTAYSLVSEKGDNSLIQEKNNQDYSKEIKKLRSFINEELKKWNVPGLSIGIVKDGKAVFAEGFGYAELESKTKVTPETNFVLASVTKTFTAMVMGILVDEGKLSWDSPVKKYLPCFQLSDKFIEEHLTIRDILSHRSGLAGHDFVWLNAPFTVEKIVSKLKFLEFSAGLREKYQYNNLMYMTAGYLTGKTAESSWENLVKEKIFGPLDMSRSGCSIEELLTTENFAFSYEDKSGELTKIPFPDKNYRVGYFPRASGSIYSNISDMANWIKLHLNRGKYNSKQVISERNITEMHKPQIVKPQNPYSTFFIQSPAYGLGWAMDSYRGTYRIHHSGETMGYSSQLFLFPTENLGIVVLSNRGTDLPSLVAYYAADQFLGLEEFDWTEQIRPDSANEVKELEPTPYAKEDLIRPLSSYAGLYEHPAYGKLSVKVENERLDLIYRKMKKSLNHREYDVFETIDDDPIPVTFYPDPYFNITHITIPLDSSVSEIEFARVEELSSDFLKKYEGEYLLAGRIIKIYINTDGRLSVEMNGAKIGELEHERDNYFNVIGKPAEYCDFIADASGKITGFKLKQSQGLFTAERK
ncbi:serine hydrolase [Acidobacteriota bacterium]